MAWAPDRLPDYVLVSREVHPFAHGGIGVYVTNLARTLADTATAYVTVIAPRSRDEWCADLRAEGHPLLINERIRLHFIDEPAIDEAENWYSVLHAWSARVFDAIVELFPNGGPDVVEFPDYLGEGCVTVQAKRTLHPGLERTRVCVRMHTTAEMASALNGHVQSDFLTQSIFALERYALRYADAVLWAGGDILETYRRFYGRDGLAHARRIRHPLLLDVPHMLERPDGPESSLRLLYLGRLERRKGVQNLLRAMTGLPDPDIHLTLLGSDTPTGPLGTSLLHQLQLMAADDERIRFLDAMPREQLPRLIASHDAVVVPSLWECWPGVALEALLCGVPVIGTPVGGLVEIVRPGVSGWRSRDASAEALADTIEQARRAMGDGSPLRRHGIRAHATGLVDADEVAEEYHKLRAPSPRRRRRSTAPLVSAIVPYFHLEQYIEETVLSLFAQTHERLEVLVVNDGSLRAEDRVLQELGARFPLRVLTQVNSGLGAARNFGIAQSRGKYVFPLDADNLVEPEFVQRCVEVLEQEPRWAYVTTWSQYIDEDGVELNTPARGYQPVSNWLPLMRHGNVAGDAAAVLRRRTFDLGFRYSQDLTSFEDWFLYRRLAAAGFYGHAIPERLLRYRVRQASMLREVGLPRLADLEAEMRAHEREEEIRWTFKSA